MNTTRKCIWKIIETRHNVDGTDNIRVSHVETFGQVIQQAQNVETDKHVKRFEFHRIWLTA